MNQSKAESPMTSVDDARIRESLNSRRRNRGALPPILLELSSPREGWAELVHLALNEGILEDSVPGGDHR